MTLRREGSDDEEKVRMQEVEWIMVDQYTSKLCKVEANLTVNFVSFRRAVPSFISKVHFALIRPQCIEASQWSVRKARNNLLAAPLMSGREV